jgi:hypothetical protein
LRGWNFDAHWLAWFQTDIARAQLDSDIHYRHRLDPRLAVHVVTNVDDTAAEASITAS